MASLLDGKIAKLVASGLKAANIPYALTLTRTVPGNGPPHNPGSPTTQTYAAQGFVDDYRADQRDGTIVMQNDRKIVVLAQTIRTTPVPLDKITARGIQYTVISVQADPALATFTCQVRA